MDILVINRNKCDYIPELHLTLIHISHNYDFKEYNHIVRHLNTLLSFNCIPLIITPELKVSKIDHSSIECN